MKKLLIIAILAAILGVLYMYRDRFFSPSMDRHCPSANEVWDSTRERCVPITSDPHPIHRDTPIPFNITEVSQVTLTIEDGGKEHTVEAMRQGTGKKFTAQFKIEDTSVEGTVVLLDEHVVHQENTDDVFIPYAVNYGGSGSFVSIGLFTRKDNTTLEMQDTYLLGDRILIEQITLGRTSSEYDLHIHFFDRKTGEAMTATPTVSKEIAIAIQEHMFGKDVQVNEHTSGVAYKDLFNVQTPTANETVVSPLTVLGKARGQWYFEASFPITVVDWDGRIIGTGYAEAQGEWMTSEYVPFKGTISFTVPPDTAYRRGTIIFRKDNPSGLPENDDSFEIPVLFK